MGNRSNRNGISGIKNSASKIRSRYLPKQLDEMNVTKPPAPLKGKGLVFSAPALVAEIEFRAWTNDGKLRHASFADQADGPRFVGLQT